MKLAWILHSKPGLPDSYVLRHGCQMTSDIHVSTGAHLDINNMDIIYHTCSSLETVHNQTYFNGKVKQKLKPFGNKLLLNDKEIKLRKLHLHD